MIRQLPIFRKDLLTTNRPDGQILVHDPVTENFFLFSRLEIQLAESLQESCSLDQWLDCWNHQNPADKIHKDFAERFLVQLVNDQLVTVAGQRANQRLANIAGTNRNSIAAKLLQNPFAIRLPGITPLRLLESLTSFCGWLFHPVVMVLVVLLIGGVAVSSLFASAQISPTKSLVWLTTFDGIASMVIVFGLIKILHELGHAIAAQYHGSRCKQIGVMFLFFVPTLYCDVSDAWRLNSRLRRILISAAGIYIELILASLAAIIWSTSSNGLIHHVAFEVMTICGISTIFINGNPLLRYDGYYILSDWLDRPNLSRAAKQELARLPSALTRRSSNHRRVDFTLVLYGLLSSTYRMFIVAAILTGTVIFCIGLSVPHVGWLIAGAMAMLLMRPYLRNRRSSNAGSITTNAFSAGRLTKFAIVAGAVAFIALVPLPRWTYVDLQVHPVDSQTVFATADGVVSSQDLVARSISLDETAVTLHQADLDNQLRVAEIELRRAKNESNQLEKRSRIFPEFSQSLAAAAELVKAKQAKYENLFYQKTQASVVSSIDGRVKSLLSKPFESRSAAQSVEVKQGQPILQIFDDSKKQIRLLVDESKIDLLKQGQPLICSFDSAGIRHATGTIGDLVPGHAKVHSTDDDAQLAKKSFLINAEIASLPNGIEVFSGGRARVQVAPTTIAARIAEFCRLTFQYK